MLKRSFDAVAAFIGLVIFSPILLAVMLAIWLQDYASPFYIAPRAARGGGSFKMIKFRSMVAGADKLGGSTTAASDPRITPVGRFVRAHKIDEIVQLWNVLRGDMSLVGPRPQTLADVQLYTAAERRMLTVRPGITDAASIVFADEGEILKGSSDADLLYNQIIRPWKSRLALASIDHQNFPTDLWLIFLTLAGTVSRPAALGALGRLLRSWKVDALVISMAARQSPLLPYPPPGLAPEDSKPIPFAPPCTPRAQGLLRYHRPIVFAAETATTLLAGALAFLLRFDLYLPWAYRPVLLVSLSVWVPVKLACIALFGVHRGSWRHASRRDSLRLLLSNLAASIISTGVLGSLTLGIPRSIYFLQFLLCVLIAAGIRVSISLISEWDRSPSPPESKQRTLIYGAGDAGVALLREIQNCPALPYKVCGFIDDQRWKTGLTIHGLTVFGDGRALAAIAQKHRAELALIAIPSASGAQMTQILKYCHAAGIRFKTIRGLGETLEENSLVHQIRDVAVEDLLGRPPVRLDEDRIRARIQGATVLVTGAGGSIGSELCRQIARFQPAAIAGFDISESALFQLEREMAHSFPLIPFHPEVGSVQDSRRVAEIFHRHRPSLVYHAAAYKHVPMMESHLFEAIENNVFGTLNVALAAGRCGVQDFVMISSDKAVNPANIMGVSKRIAELLIRSLQSGHVKYVSVRFGNVLGSAGSVVPIFKEQIARGGPVTVTHPEIRRYFMTIPEATQLVLQSSTMGKGGEIFVLDMGEPVRILDLARNLILLSGLRPEDDIRIAVTGLRPGEKLFEELNLLNENMLPTYHEKIRIFAGRTVPWTAMERHLGRLRHQCEVRGFNESIRILKELVPDYSPSSELLQQVLAEATQLQAMAAGDMGPN
jgi:FlaA1/EpsC-like NDP-sugar epimerase/lipopolysaccharide/colanic/teichoic acid biosynthesis glycosyltransferase